MKIVHVTYWNREPWEESEYLTFGYFSTMEKAKKAIQDHARDNKTVMRDFDDRTKSWCFDAREAQLAGQEFNKPEPKIEDCFCFDEYEVDVVQ